MFTLLVIIIVLAFIFDYINGFHDAANSIATIVSTKVLTPFQAVLWAAVFNFAAFFISKYIFKEFGIGNTVAKWVNAEFITATLCASGKTTKHIQRYSVVGSIVTLVLVAAMALHLVRNDFAAIQSSGFLWDALGAYHSLS